jgi:hypothetical protein
MIKRPRNTPKTASKLLIVKELEFIWRGDILLVKCVFSLVLIFQMYRAMNFTH